MYITRLIKRQLAKSIFLHNVFKLLTGSLIAQSIGIITAPIISRIFDPSDYGHLAIYISTVTVLCVISTLKFDVAIVIANTRRQVIDLFFASQIGLITIVLFSLIIVLSFKNLILNLLNIDPSVGSLIYFIPFGVLVSGQYQIFSNLCNKLKLYGTLSISRVTSSLSAFVANFISGWYFKYSLGLLIGNIISNITSLFILLFKIKSHIKFRSSYQGFRLTQITTTLIAFKDFPKYSFPSSLLDTFSLHLPIFMITILFSEEILGNYSFAFRMLSLPSSMIAASVGKVFYQEFSDLYKNDKKLAFKRLLSTWKYLFFVAIIPFSLVTLFGHKIFPFVFGNSWNYAGEISQVIAPMLLLMFISSPTSSAFITLRKQSIPLIFSMTLFTFRIISLVIGAFYKDFILAIKLFVIFETIQIIIFNIILIRYLND